MTTENTIQPERYVESDEHVPDPTDQYGVVITNGPSISVSDGIDYATPLFREHRIAREGEDPTQDEYFLTDAQRAAAATPEDAAPADEVAEPGEEAPAPAEEPAGAPEGAAPAE